MFTCGYCMKQIAVDEPISSININFTKGEDFSEHQGETIPIYLHTLEREIPMVVPTADSEAKRQGNDGMFPVCSDSCGIELQAILKEEVNQGE